MLHDILTLRDLIPGACCYFRSADGRFVAFTQGAGFHLSRTGCRTWFEITEMQDARMVFRSAHGPYLCANPDGIISAATSPSRWHTSALSMSEGSRVCLVSTHGGYLCALEGSDTLTLSESLPVLNQSVALLRAFEPQQCEQAIRSARPAPNIVWAFWDAGRDAMCPFHQLNARAWQHVLGPEWRINLLNAVDGDEWNACNFVAPETLPASFAKLPAVVKSDAVRLALLSSYGGIWLDVGIVLFRTLDEICWQEMRPLASGTLLGGFFNSDWGSDHLARRDYFENWFIAARRENVLIERWRQVFVEYWNNRLVSTRIWDDPLFESLDLSNFQRFGLDLRTYLTSHVAFRKVLESDPHLHRLWKHNMWLRDACDGPFLLPRLVGWEPPDIYRALIAENRGDLLEQLRGTPLLKFTGGMASHLTRVSERTLLDPSCTMGGLYRRIFDSSTPNRTERS